MKISKKFINEIRFQLYLENKHKDFNRTSLLIIKNGAKSKIPLNSLSFFHLFFYFQCTFFFIIRNVFFIGKKSTCRIFKKVSY